MSTRRFFPDMLEDESLEKFLDRLVRPDTTFLTQGNQVIDAVVRLLQQRIPYNVSQIIKGGSLGKGTGVRNMSDVDLLVVLNDYKSIGDLMVNLPTILLTIEEFLETKLQHFIPDARVIMYESTPFTLRFRLKRYDSHEWFDVDLLPIIDVWSNWLLIIDGKKITYDTMEVEPDTRSNYSKCLAKLQVEFVKPLPAKTKDLIRLLKYWNKMESVGMSSYGIELLVIYVWEKEGCGYSYTLKSLMTSVVEELVRFRQLKISWNKNYDPEKYCRSMSAPYILDPANPFNNLAPVWRASTIESKARELQRRLTGLPEDGAGLMMAVGAAFLEQGAKSILKSIFDDKS